MCVFLLWIKLKVTFKLAYGLYLYFFQRCDYSALTKFLPPKHEYVISVKCSETQIKMYQHYLDNLSQRKADRKIQGGTLFADYNVLRNLCTHPYIVHTSYERAEERRVFFSSIFVLLYCILVMVLLVYFIICEKVFIW